MDNWLIDNVFERFAHWFQRLTGKNNFFLAFVCVILGFILELASRLELQKHGPIISTSWLLASFIDPIYPLIINILSSTFLNKGGGRGLRSMNTLRIDPITTCMRFIWMAFAVTMTPLALIASSSGYEGWQYVIFPIPNYLYTFSLYFSACTPLPPSESKIRKWVSSIQNHLHQFGEKEELPSPAPA